MKIALAGDWHGNDEWALSVIRALAQRGDIDTLLHVGDFGIWPDGRGRRYRHAVDAALIEAGITLGITPGNHEDWGMLWRRWRNQTHPQPLRMGERITILPAGHRFQIDGRSFVSLGGAPSIDYQSRTRGADWWPEEIVTDDDVERTVSRGHADVMLTHDAPSPPRTTPRVARIIASNPMNWSPHARSYASAGRAQIDRALLGVKPRVLVHGHLHTADMHRHTQDDWTLDVVALNMDGQAGNVAILDTDALACEFTDIERNDDTGEWVRRTS